MNLLDLDPAAKHFCASAAAPVANGVSQSLPAFHTSLAGIGLLEEGQARFAIHQKNLVDSAARWLVYSLTHYRRAVEMLVPASAPWAQVTLYYSSFFAANAILAMFGGWIGHTSAGAIVVDVERENPGNQALRIHRRFKSPRGARGSHKQFWDIFYDAVGKVSPWAPAHLIGALAPVNADYAWQISERNGVNYDMFHAWQASVLLYQTFSVTKSKFRELSGPIRLQLDASEELLRLALYFAGEVGIENDALMGCGFVGSRKLIQRRLVSQAVPQFVAQSAISSLFDT
jgi:hypothetical protein